jgi:hypothetical protein
MQRSRHRPSRVSDGIVRASVAAIPVSVRESFTNVRGGEPFTMAEPGAEWQARMLSPTRERTCSRGARSLAH